MKSRKRKYVLGESAAAALRPLLQRGAKFNSRPRPAHYVAPPAAAGERLPFRLEVREVSGTPHAVAPYGVYAGSSVGFLNRQLVSYGAQNIVPASGLPTVSLDGTSWLDFGALSAATNLWLVVTPPTGDLQDHGSLAATGSWTIASQVARPVAPWSSSGVYTDGRICILLGRWTPTGGLVRTWVGGVFAFAGPVMETSAITSLRKSGSTLYYNVQTKRFDGGILPTVTNDERSISL